MAWRDIIEIVGFVFMAYIAVSEFLLHKRQKAREDDKATAEAQAALELKVKTLEGKIESQYSELSARLSSMEKAMSDSKNDNFIFETRIIQTVDKVDSKLDRLQDLFVSIKLKQQ